MYRIIRCCYRLTALSSTDRFTVSMFVTCSSFYFAILFALVTTLSVELCLNSSISGFGWLVCIRVDLGYPNIIGEHVWILSVLSGISLSFTDVRLGWLIFFVLVVFSTSITIKNVYRLLWFFYFLLLQLALSDHVWKVFSLYLILYVVVEYYSER